MSTPKVTPAQVWQAELNRAGVVRFRFRVRDGLAIMIAIPFVLAAGIGLLFTQVTAGVIVGAVILALYAIVVTATARRMISGYPIVRIDRVGVAVDSREVGWEEVTAVVTYKLGRNRFAVLGITPEASARIRAGMSRLQRALEPAGNPAAGGPALVLPQWHGYRAQDLTDWLAVVLNDARRRRSRGDPPTPTAPA